MVETKSIEMTLTSDNPMQIFENLNGSSVSFFVSGADVGGSSTVVLVFDASLVTDTEDLNASLMAPLELIRLGATSVMDVVMEADETELHGALDIINKVSISSSSGANNYVVVGAKNCKQLCFGAMGDNVHITVRACTE